MVARLEGYNRMGVKGEESKKYKLVATEQSWGYNVQHRAYSSQGRYMHDPWTWKWWVDSLRRWYGLRETKRENYTTVIALKI